MSSASKRPQEIGSEFENEFIERKGLKRVVASGSQWHSKLDAHGHGARWSLKATGHASYSIKPEDLAELHAANAPGQSGEMRLMAICIGRGSMQETTVIVMLEEDFDEIAAGEITLVTEDRTETKRRTAAIPELLREENE